MESHLYTLSSVGPRPAYVFGPPPVMGTPITVDTRWLPGSKEFKEALLADLHSTTPDCRIRIQAYHFDCGEIVAALSTSRIWSMDVIADARAAREAPKTATAVQNLLNAGADVRLVAGKDMTPLYGPGRGIFGI